MDRKDIACQCGCGFAAMDYLLIDIIGDLETELSDGIKIPEIRTVITSGCRCPAHNKSEGGAPDSFHIKGMALDFYVKDYRGVIEAPFIYEVLDSILPSDSSGLYYNKKTNMIHVDVRPDPWRGGNIS